MSAQPAVPKANLTYYIFEGVLVGNAGGRSFHLLALSGGGGGSTKSRPAASMNNPYMTALKTTSPGAQHQHGGPLPSGWYKILKPAQHPHLGRSALLEPRIPNAMMGRGGFFIHGRGPHGSDGCIVPLSQFKELMDALDQSGGGTLRVEEGLGASRFA